MAESTKPPTLDRSAWHLLVGGLIFLLAMAVRLPLISQSLWYDEMYTTLNFVHQPVAKVVGFESVRKMLGRPERPGDVHTPAYSPNNHILHTLACKAVNAVAVRAGVLSRGEESAQSADGRPWFSEPILRLVSLLAGSAVGIALAWPLRRKHPLAAVVLALVASLNPWLINFSTEARGYSMMLLWCIIATNCLPQRKSVLAWGYVGAMVAALYTVPVCMPIIACHGLAMLLLRREHFWTWARSAGLALAAISLLYVPFINGIIEYYTPAPPPPSIAYGRYLLELSSHLQTGQYAPGISYIVLALAVILLGGAVAWGRAELRPSLVSFGAMALLGIVAPIKMRSFGEIRFMSWLIPLYAMGITAVLLAPGRWFVQVAQIGAAVVLLLSITTSAMAMEKTPKQPLREGAALARALADADAPNHVIVGVHLAAMETKIFYDHIDLLAYRVGKDDEEAGPDLLEVEKAIRDRRWEPWLLVPYDISQQKPQLWGYINQHYELARRLNGRVSPFFIYKPRPAAAPATTQK